MPPPVPPPRFERRRPNAGRFRGPAALAAVAAVSLASCGGESDRKRIEDAIVAKFASDDAAACTDHATERFLEQLEGARGRAAVEVCKRSAGDPGSVARSVELSSLTIDGGRATARVAIDGSRLDGQTPTLRLVEEDGEWKLDEIAGLHLKGRLLDQFESRFRSEVLSRSRLSAAQADCILQRIEAELSSAELTDLVGDELPDALRAKVEAATARCASEG